MKELSRLRELREINGLSQYQLAKRAGLSVRTIKGYEYCSQKPSIESYNALAEILGFEKVDEPEQVKVKKNKNPVQTKNKKSQKQYDKVEHTDNDDVLLAIKTPKPLFEMNHLYAIYESSKDEDFTFRYVGKDGIHHYFIEIHGGWTRTYTDYQLIGKTVKEVDDGRQGQKDKK